MSLADSIFDAKIDDSERMCENPTNSGLPLTHRDLDECWDKNLEYSSDVTFRLLEPLSEQLRNNDDILLLTHGAGAIFSYECLHRIRYELDDIPGDAKISKWIMLGAPFGSMPVKEKLLGYANNNFPYNCKNMVNVVGKYGLLGNETDMCSEENECMTDLVETQEKSECRCEKYRLNVSSSLEYLINPFVVKHIYDWVRS